MRRFQRISMIFARTWGALTGLVDCLTASVPNVLRKSIDPSTGVAIANRAPKPPQDNPVFVCQTSGAYTGVRSVPLNLASKARPILVINTSYISARPRDHRQIYTGRRRLNLSSLDVRSLVTRFSHTVKLLSAFVTGLGEMIDQMLFRVRIVCNWLCYDDLP